jgi:hypothetical protein
MKKYIIIIVMALIASYATAQSNESKKKIKMVSGTVSDADGPCWMANVVEVDKQNRIVGHVATDSLGHFTLKVVNPKDKIQISYIGTKTMTLDINKEKYNIILEFAKPEMTVEELNKLKRTVNSTEWNFPEPSPVEQSDNY